MISYKLYRPADIISPEVFILQTLTLLQRFDIRSFTNYFQLKQRLTLNFFPFISIYM